MSTRLLLPIISLVACVTGGCAQPSDQHKTTGETLVEAPHTALAMTPAQRGRKFRAFYDEGLALAERGQYGLALGAFEKAVALKPTSVEALFNLGACYEATGDPLRAINIYHRVQEQTPNDPDCYANLGTSFIKMYYRERSPVWRKMARQAWRRSLELDPGQPDIRRFLTRSEVPD